MNVEYINPGQLIAGDLVILGKFIHLYLGQKGTEHNFIDSAGFPFRCMSSVLLYDIPGGIQRISSVQI